MATHRTDDHQGHLEDPPEVLQVTVISDGDGWQLRGLVAALSGRLSGRGIVALVLGVALAIGGILAATSHGGARERAAVAPGRGTVAPAGIRSAYGYPVRCLSLAIVLHDPRFARAGFDRTRPCGANGGYVAAAIDRAALAWHRLHGMTVARCPVRSPPATLQDEQAVCP